MLTGGLGPHGERAFPADKLVLKEAEAALACAGRFAMAIVLHTTTSDWSRQELARIIATLGRYGATVTEIIDCAFDKGRSRTRRVAEACGRADPCRVQSAHRRQQLFSKAIARSRKRARSWSCST